MGKVNILFVGDVFGRTGRETLTELLPGLISEHKIDYCIVKMHHTAEVFPCNVLMNFLWQVQIV